MRSSESILEPLNAGIVRRVSRVDWFATFGHVGFNDRAVCKAAWNIDVQQHSLGISQHARLWMDCNILSRAYLDKMCGDCRIITREKLLRPPNLITQQMYNTRLRHRTQKNMEIALTAITS